MYNQDRLKVLIIEDDELSAYALCQIMENNFSNIFEKCITVTNVNEGIKTIHQLAPDLVFLDIGLPEKDGFQLFNEISWVKFYTIITSTDSSRGLDAIKIQAVDYLIKPLDYQNLSQAVHKFLLKRINHQSSKEPRIRLDSPNGVLITEPSHIVYCEAVGNNTLLYYANRISQQISKPLKEIEEILVKYGFYRIQKSFLINMNHTIEYNKTEGGFVVLKHYEDIRIPVSKNIKEHFLMIFS